MAAIDLMFDGGGNAEAMLNRRKANCDLCKTGAPSNFITVHRHRPIPQVASMASTRLFSAMPITPEEIIVDIFFLKRHLRGKYYWSQYEDTRCVGSIYLRLSPGRFDPGSVCNLHTSVLKSNGTIATRPPVTCYPR